MSKKWYNNGTEQVLRDQKPEGFIEGRKNYNNVGNNKKRILITQSKEIEFKNLASLYEYIKEDLAEIKTLLNFKHYWYTRKIMIARSGLYLTQMDYRTIVKV